MRRLAAIVCLAFAMSTPPPTFAPSATVEILTATGALPAHLAGQFQDPIGFVQASTGEYLVLDRRAHTVYLIDAKQTAVRKVVQAGFEEGSALRPGVLALSTDDIFAVADAPGGLERIQYFSLTGTLLGGFYLETRLAPRVIIGSRVLNGVGSMHFTGKTFLVNRPETGALFQEIDNAGRVLRQLGTLRPTGHESDPELHHALNIGMPLADPGGGFIFVFQTGVPMFRKYDAAGTLLYERHIEGPELDPQIQGLPTIWPARPAGDAGTRPLVDPLVRTAAVDPSGRLWVSLMAPFTHVYDGRGEKIRTVQFRGAGLVSPASMTFARGDRLLVAPGCYEFSAK